MAIALICVTIYSSSVMLVLTIAGSFDKETMAKYIVPILEYPNMASYTIFIPMIWILFTECYASLNLTSF